MAEPDVPEPLREPDRPGPARLAREAPERLEPGRAVPRDGNPDEADEARAEPGETNALPASHAVDRPEDEEGGRDPLDPDGRDPGHSREVRPPARCERERADDEQQVITASLWPPPPKWSASSGFQPTKAAANAGRAASDAARTAVPRTETAATRRNSQAARSGSSPAMRAWKPEPSVNSGP